jgi:MFS family permease
MSELARKYMNRGELKNLVLFSAGKSVSMFASSIYSFAIGLYVLKLTGSALNYATTIMLHILPMIIMSPVAGVLADKISKKKLIVGMDLANGFLFLGLFRISSG